MAWPWKHGNRAGYGEYRYGPRRKVTLAAVSMTASPPAVVSKKSDQFVSAVMDTLRDWRSSPFEYEGITRRALRNWFIDRKHGWDLSDAEALALIANAFDALGIERPSWFEGQWKYTESRTQCVGCGADIDDEDQAKGRRFCSPLCAKSSLETRIKAIRTAEDWVYQRAHYEIAVSGSPERPCKICGTMFKSRRKGAEHCSPACRRAAKGDLLSDIKCLECETVFHPADRHKKYCCKACAWKGIVKTREAALMQERSCECCRAIFRPRTSYAIYCSTRCARVMANRAYRARQRVAASNVIYLTAEIFDGWFRHAA